MALKSSTIKLLLSLTVMVLIIIVVSFTPQRSQRVIRIHDDQIELQKLANAIASFIIVNGYNHRVELVESTIKEARGHLINGDIDITLELWRENNLLWLSKAMTDNQVSNLGAIYSGGKQYWIVSKWYAQEHGIESVFDMKEHWQSFLDPDDPSKGLFFNCIFGWTCRDINRVKLQAYGLDKYYNTVSPVSPKSLKSIYVNAQTRKLPVFGYYWEPNSIMTKQDWHILTEPDYSEKVWLNIITAASSPAQSSLTEACTYQDSGALKVANINLASKAPRVYQMFQKMEIDMKFFHSTVLSSDLLENKLAPEILAEKFLKQYPDIWSSWVPDDIQAKIKRALTNKNKNRSAGE